MHCPHCSQNNPENFRFCQYCGNPLTTEVLDAPKRPLTAPGQRLPQRRKGHRLLLILELLLVSLVLIGVLFRLIWPDSLKREIILPEVLDMDMDPLAPLDVGEIQENDSLHPANKRFNHAQLYQSQVLFQNWPLLQLVLEMDSSSGAPLRNVSANDLTLSERLGNDLPLPLQLLSLRPLYEIKDLHAIFLIDNSHQTAEEWAKTQKAWKDFFESLDLDNLRLTVIALAPTPHFLIRNSNQIDPLLTAIDALEAEGRADLYKGIDLARIYLLQHQSSKVARIFAHLNQSLHPDYLGEGSYYQQLQKLRAPITLLGPQSVLDQLELQKYPRLAVYRGGIHSDKPERLADDLRRLLNQWENSYLLTCRTSVPLPLEQPLVLEITLGAIQARIRTQLSPINSANKISPVHRAPGESPTASCSPTSPVLN